MILKLNGMPVYCGPGGDPELCDEYKDLVIYQVQEQARFDTYWHHSEMYRNLSDAAGGIKHIALGTADFCNGVWHYAHLDGAMQIAKWLTFSA